MRLVLEVPFGSEKGALVLQRPPLSGTGNPLPGPPGTCLSVSLEGGAGAWAGRECGGPILTPALPRGAAGRSTASPKTSFLSLSHALIHSFIRSFTFNRCLLSKAPFNGAEAAWVYKVDKAPCHGPILLREGR